MKITEIDPTKTTMIVVDMQNDFVAVGGGLETPAARAIVPKLSRVMKMCRDAGIRVIYTTHAHRRDGCDMGLFDDLHPPIANRDALVDGTSGVEIYPDLAPMPGEHVIKKHRYSGFFGTDLDIILREWGTDTVIISGTTTENCCHATARDAMFLNYGVLFLSDATATYDYPDCGFGPMANAEVRHATLVILAASTAHVMPVADFEVLLAKRAKPQQ
jgi:nicotinamidase-related amidase